MQKNAIVPLVLVGGGLVILTIILFMFIPSFNLAGSVVGGGLGASTLSLGQVNLVTSTGLTTSTVWQGTLSYSGMQSNQLIGTDFTTNPTLLQTLTGQRARDQINIDSEVNRLSCNYPVSLAQDAGVQHYALNNLPVIVQPGNSNTDTSCAAALLGQQHNYNAGIRTSDVCSASYRNTCTAQGGTYLINNAVQTWNGINFDGTPSYICTQLVADTSRTRYTVYQPTSFNPDVNIRYTVTNTVTNAVETINLNPSNPVATSSDRKVRVQLDGGSTAFNTQCPEYSDWYILMPNVYFAPQAIVVSRNSVSNLRTPTPSAGATLTAAQSTLNSYNSGVDALSGPTQNYLDSGNINYNNFRTLAYPLTGNSLNTNGQLMIDRTNYPFLYPRAIVQIATDFAGVYEPLARPQIQSIVPNPVTLAQNGLQQKIDVFVANTGDSGSAITTTLSCSPSGITIQGSTGGRSVSSSVPGDFEFYIAGNQGTYTCTARACDSQLLNCVTQNFPVNVRAQCDAGPRPTDNYGLVYANDGSCSWQCNINSCPTGYTLNNCACTPPSGGNNSCAAPSNLRSCETWNVGSCTTSINPGYTIQNGMCVAGNQTGGNLSCQQQVNAIQCSPVDFLCPINKTIGSANCGLQSLASVTSNLVLIIGLVCGSVVLVILIGVGGVLASRKSGGRRK